VADALAAYEERIAPMSAVPAPARFTAGGPEDPQSGMAQCVTCNRSDLHYLNGQHVWISGNGESHTGHELELLPERTSQQTGGSEETSLDDLVRLHGKVEADCTEDGWVFLANGERFGSFSLKEMNGTQFDVDLAFRLEVEPKEILAARLRNYRKEITAEELSGILTSTVKRDEPTKKIVFLNMVLAQTNEDQFNVGFEAESSTGKSYIPLEIAEYFPDDEKRTYAGASPTSFYHEVGRWRPLSEIAQEVELKGLFDKEELADEKRKVILVNLERKLLVFMDQPHWMLMEKLRPLLSHDKKILRYAITDRTGKGGLRSKTVIILGYSSVFFCTAKPTQDDQEKTRLTLLSPEASQEKIREALWLQAHKIGDRRAFREWIETHPLRRWLKERVHIIRASGIKEIIIPAPEKVLERFLEKRPRLAPRAQRDFPRLMSFIKGFALLNCFTRTLAEDHAILADDQDVEEGFRLYEQVASPNELGLSPETYRIYEEIIRPLSQSSNGENIGVPRTEIIKRYLQTYGRPMPWERLTKQILPALESAGLVHQEKNPDDKRETLAYCTDVARISGDSNNTGNNSAVTRPEISKRCIAEERDRVLGKLRAIGGRFSWDDAALRASEVTGDRLGAEDYLERFQAEGLLAQGPDGYWRLTK